MTPERYPRRVGILLALLCLSLSIVTALPAAADDPPAPVPTTGVPGLQPFNQAIPLGGYGDPVGFTPQQLAKVYGLSTKPTGAKARPIVITVAGHSDTLLGDVNQTRYAAGLPALKMCANAKATGCLDVRSVRGGTDWTPYRDFGWALEEALDVTTATALSPNSRVLVVEADEPLYFGDGGMGAAIAMGRKLIGPGAVYNMSWGSGEFPDQTLFADTYLSNASATYIAASGDWGFGAFFPASSKRAFSIGGTTLTIKNNGQRANETVWAGSGAGCSAYTPKPGQNTKLCGNYKALNDMAAVGDPYTGLRLFFQGDVYSVGGTSLSAPIVSAIAATTPGTAKRPTNGHKMFDVTEGNNCLGPVEPICSAGKSYDLPTGWGTPKGGASPLT